MKKLVLFWALTSLFFSCVSTSTVNSRLSKFKDPDTGVETVETIISFGDTGDETLISFNQTKNPKNINWYIIGKFATSKEGDYAKLDLTIDKKVRELKVGGAYNTYDIKTTNSKLFKKVEYYRIDEEIISDINKCVSLKLTFVGTGRSEDFTYSKEQLKDIKEWIKNITIPK